MNTIPAVDSLFYSLIVALGALIGGRAVVELLRQKKASVAARAVALLPLLTPVLLTGYAYANFCIRLLDHKFILYAFYCSLQIFRMSPLAGIIMHLTPKALSKKARFCFLLSRPGFWERVWFSLRSPARGWMAAAALVFIYSFSEFEMASLMNVETWSVRLFDSQSQGTPLGVSFTIARIPLLTEILGAAVFLFVTARSRLFSAPPREGTAPVSTEICRVCWAYAIVALVLVLALPIYIIFSDAFSGFAAAIKDFNLEKDLLVSLAFSGMGAIMAMWMSESVAGCIYELRRNNGSLFRPTLQALLLITPGLLGGLLLSLTVLALFQLPVLGKLYDSPVPLLLGLTFLLMPFGVVLRLLFLKRGSGIPLHCAGILKDSENLKLRRTGNDIVWIMEERPKAIIFAILFYLAYFELTTGILLAPVSYRTVWNSLYNFMHYGRSSMLSARVIIAFLAPVTLFSVLYSGYAKIQRWRNA